MTKMQKVLAITLYIFVQVFVLGMLYSLCSIDFEVYDRIKFIQIGMLIMLELFIAIVTLEMLKEVK